MRIIAADSGTAILDNQFRAELIVSTVAGLVESPYRKISACIAKPVFSNVEDGHLLITHELKMCQQLLKKVKADVVHLDMSLNGMPVEELTVVELSKMRVSRKARQHILKILPKLRKLALDIKRVFGVEVLAMGKESIPVRITELTCGAFGVFYTIEKALSENKNLKVGLPSKCTIDISKDGISLKSLIPNEHDLISFVKDSKEVLHQVNISEIHNPCARGFRLLQIEPRT